MSPKKKKKKQSPSSRPISPTILQNKKKHRPARFTIVERRLDFGTTEGLPSEPPHQETFRRQQNISLPLSSRNRYDLLNTSNESNTSSVTASANSVSTNLLSNVVSSLNNSPVHVNTPASLYTTPISTPNDFNFNIQTTLPSYIIPTIQHATPTTTSSTISNIVTTTTLTFTHGTIVHSTPTKDSQPFFPDRPPVPPPPPSTLFTHETDVESLNYHPIRADRPFPQRSSPHDTIMVYETSAEQLENPPPDPPSTPPPSLYPNVVIKTPPQADKKRKLAPNSSSSSNNHTSPSARAPTTLHTSPVPIDPTSPRSRAQTRVPAIHIYVANNNELIKAINKRVTEPPQYKFNNTSLLCIPKTFQDHHKIIHFLTESNTEYYTHNPRNLRPVKLTVKYIPLDTPDDDIKDDLLQQNLPLTRLARVMVTKDNKRQASNILLLTVPKEAVSDYYALQQLCHFKVTVLAYQGPVINQCHNCQGFAHSSEMCSRRPACIRCGQAHKGQPCAASSCTCVNCGGNHPANYRGCPAYQTALLRYAPREAQDRNLPPTVKQPPLLQPADFPPLPTQQPESRPTETLPKTQPLTWSRPSNRHAAGPPPSASQDTAFSSLREIWELIRQLNIPQILATIRAVLQKLRETTDPLEKIFLIIETLVNYFSDGY